MVYLFIVYSAPWTFNPEMILRCLKTLREQVNINSISRKYSLFLAPPNLCRKNSFTDLCVCVCLTLDCILLACFLCFLRDLSMLHLLTMEQVILLTMTSLLMLGELVFPYFLTGILLQFISYLIEGNDGGVFARLPYTCFTFYSCHFS